MSRLSSEVSAIIGIVSKASSAHPTPLAQPTSAAQNPRQGNVDHSTSIILFGLPEGSLVDKCEVVDEISTFLTGSVKDIKDMFHIGKKSDDRCRPTIVKFLTVWDKRLRPTIVKFRTVWDKRLLLAAKFKLKSFSKSGIFIRPDLSRDERLTAAAKRSFSH